MPRREDWQFAVTDDLNSLREPWQALAPETGSIFATWDWLAAWWHWYGSGSRLVIGCLRDEIGQLRAIAPVVIARRAGVRVARLMGHGPGDELGPVAAMADVQVATATLADTLRETRQEWDFFVGERLPAGVSEALPQVSLVRPEENFVIRADLGWEAYMGSRSAHFRQALRRFERVLRRTNKLTYRLGNGGPQDLDVLFRLHRQRWRSTNTAFSRSEQFHRDVARMAVDEGWLRLWFLEVDDVPRAAWLGFRIGRVESYYQSGRDPAWDHASIGFLLLGHTIRAALEDGATEYRLLRGAESYKSRFATDRGFRETVFAGSGPLTRVVARGAAIAMRQRLVRQLGRRLIG